MSKTHENAKAYIEKALKSLPEKDDSQEYFNKFLEAYPNAVEAADNGEKVAILDDTAIKVANQLSFTLFRNNLLTDELESEYRSLPTVSYTQGVVKKEQESRQAENDKITELVTKSKKEQEEVDIFIQILAGRSREEAEENIQKYNQRAMGA